MSTSRHRLRSHRHGEKPGRRTARTVFVIAALFAVFSSTSAVAGLEPDASFESPPNQTADLETSLNVEPTRSQTAETNEAQLERRQISTECDPNTPGSCTEVPTVPVARLVSTEAIEDQTLCALNAAHDPSGSIATVPGNAGDATATDVIRFQVQIEDGLAIDADCFAATALSILADEQGWTASENIDFARVDDDSYDFKLVLASPNTTDRLCRPLNTAGRYSCRNGRRVVINVMRWESGTDDYTDNLTAYRTYLLNHEVGHFLGKGHRSCPAQGELAPVMMQQTKGLKGCLPNGWPTEGER
ncbi:MAG: DUF3152 domain-containing protein [Acidimicrobiia bacterium]|nr:DUF3152 domain-containing protein [Acidimicrobiia bacterium]